MGRFKMRFRPFLFPSDFVVWCRIGNGKNFMEYLGVALYVKEEKKKLPVFPDFKAK